MSKLALLCVGFVLVVAILIQRSSYLNVLERDDLFNPSMQMNPVAPFIFDSFFSLWTQWPNSYSPNGHTIVTGTISAHTPLFHVHYGAWNPKQPKFFAFDV
jgi:hypothetical protein